MYLLVVALCLEAGGHTTLPWRHQLLVRLRVHHDGLIIVVSLRRRDSVGVGRTGRRVLRMFNHRLSRILMRRVEADLDATVVDADTPALSVRLGAALGHTGVLSGGLLDTVLHVLEA